MPAKNMFKKCRKVPNGAVPQFFFHRFFIHYDPLCNVLFATKVQKSLHRVEGWAAREVTGCGVG